MSIIDKFLNELNERIQAVSANVSDINYQRNKALEIENIFFYKGIDKHSFSLEDLIKLTKEEYEVVLNNIENEKNALKLCGVHSFLAFKPIIELFQNLSAEHGENSIIGADQYQEAVRNLSFVVAEVKAFMKRYSSEKASKDTASIDNVDVLKSQVSLFRAGVLATPIFEWNKFERVVNLTDLSSDEKAELYKVVGQSNFKLIMLPNLLKEETDALNKYRQIYNKKYKKIKKYVNVITRFITEHNITEINESNASEVINFIANGNEELSFRAVQNTVICLLMASELGKADEFMEYEHSIEETKEFVAITTNNLDSILALSKIEPLIKEVEEVLDLDLSAVPAPEIFVGLEGVAELKIPETLTLLDGEDFDDTVGLRDVEIPNDLPAAEDEAESELELEEKIDNLAEEPERALELADLIEEPSDDLETDDFEELAEDSDELAEDLEEDIENPTTEFEELEMKSLEELPINDEAKALIDRINKILEDEAEFLRKIDPDDYNRFPHLLALKSQGNTNDQYDLALIIESLKQELNSFRIDAVKYTESPDEFASNYNSKKAKIKDYLEGYEILKARIPSEGNNKKLLYLANANNSALMLYYLDEFDDEKKIQLNKLLAELKEKDPKNAKKIFTAEEKDILSAGKKNVSVAYVKLDETLKLILLAFGKTKKSEEDAKMVISHYLDDINKLIARAASRELPMLLDEQASIREHVDNYFGEIVGKKK